MLAFTAPTVGFAAHAPRIPRDAPQCARQQTPPIFLSPMGEPFRGEPGQPYPSAVWFAGADKNRDGAVSRGEMVADAARFFATLDRDHDGKLSPVEIDLYEREVAPETALLSVRSFDPYDQSRRRSRDRDAMVKSGEYGGPMGAGRYSWLNIPEPVAAADKDMDRVITLEEFEQAAASTFDRLDVLGSGQLRLADLPRTPAQIAIEGPCRAPKNKDGDGAALP